MSVEYRARRFFHSVLLDEDFREYREKTWDIIDHYRQKYRQKIDEQLEDGRQSCIRMWLHYKDRWEEMGGTVSEELHDYKIKSILDIGPLNDKYHHATRFITGLDHDYDLEEFLALGLFTMPERQLA